VWLIATLGIILMVTAIFWTGMPAI
jgi:hypothetical protein